MNRLSITIITLNEEENIARCLESVKWADEIIIVDSHSTDRTIEIASQYKCKVYTIDWPGFGLAKQKAVDSATGEWVLSIDADEVVSDTLREEIQRVIREASNFDGYEMSRKANFLGRWILHCGWYPDYVNRLFKKGRGRFDDALVHEHISISGNVGRLKGDLLHYSYPNLEIYFEKFNRYTTLGSQEALKKGKHATWFDIVIKPLISFIKHYISKRGFLDGMEGFILSVLSASSVLVKYVKLRQLEKANRLRKKMT